VIVTYGHSTGRRRPYGSQEAAADIIAWETAGSPRFAHWMRAWCRTLGSWSALLSRPSTQNTPVEVRIRTRMQCTTRSSGTMLPQGARSSAQPALRIRTRFATFSPNLWYHNAEKVLYAQRFSLKIDSEPDLHFIWLDRDDDGWQSGAATGTVSARLSRLIVNSSDEFHSDSRRHYFGCLPHDGVLRHANSVVILSCLMSSAMRRHGVQVCHSSRNFQFSPFVAGLPAVHGPGRFCPD